MGVRPCWPNAASRSLSLLEWDTVYCLSHTHTHTHTHTREQRSECSEALVLLPSVTLLSLTVYTQRPGGQERPGHREQLHEDRRLRAGQGRPQHRLLQEDHQRESQSAQLRFFFRSSPRPASWQKPEVPRQPVNVAGASVPCSCRSRDSQPMRGRARKRGGASAEWTSAVFLSQSCIACTTSSFSMRGGLFITCRADNNNNMPWCGWY